MLFIYNYICYNYHGDFMEWYHILLIVLLSLVVLLLLFNIIIGYIGYKNTFKKVKPKNKKLSKKRRKQYEKREEGIVKKIQGSS